MAEKKNKKETGFQIVKQTLKYFLPIAAKYKPGYFVLMVLSIILNTVKPFINIFFPAMIIDELVSTLNITNIVIYTVITVAGNVLLDLLGSLCYVSMEKYADSFENYFNIEIAKRAMEMDFPLTENKDALDQVEKAKQGMQWYSGGVHGICLKFQRIITGITTLAGVCAVLINGAPFMMLIAVIVLVITSYLNNKNNKIEIENYKELSKINRIFGYTLFELSDFRFGKDIRLYKAKNMMLNKGNVQAEAMTKNWKNLSKKQLPNSELDITVGAIRDGVNYFYLAWLVLSGIITLGDFSKFSSAAGTFTMALQDIIFGYQEIVKSCTYAREYLLFMNYPPYISQGTEKPKSCEHTIEFRNVFFKYPNTENYILKGVSITLHNGEHLSVVGLNGAGKTTFIKLLCRLYDVTEGEILLDGKNIKEYDFEEYAKIFSVVFQDFKLFAFSILENIAAEESENEGTRERVEQLIKLVGLEEKTSSLEKGADTVLFKQFEEDGIEPSGGEQQKIAIARALYKNAPIVILDEPTAALDPVAEYDIYRQFDKLVGGKTAVYISHRLSSCKFCDKIAVFSDGVIKEYGTHDQLVGLKDGIYAEMFAAQAQYYT
ncbi:MAG: ABC transporter ATP-binding protein [Ruminiclostridium sp.]